MKMDENDMRIPPSNLKAEQEVLGSMLQTDGGLDATAVVRIMLKATDFYNTEHQQLYSAILEVTDSGSPVDDLTASPYQKLYHDNPNSEKLTPIYIEYLKDSMPTAANAEYYAKQVKECAVLRAIIQISNKVKFRAFETDREGIPATELIVELQQVLNENEVITSIAGKIPSARDDWGSFISQLSEKQKHEFLGLRTGFDKLDQALSGLRGLSVLGGIPGQGKTSLALQIVTEVARINDIPVLYYVLEMSKFDMYTKIISRISSLDFTTLTVGSVIDGRRGQGLSEDDWHKFQDATADFTLYADKIKIIDRAVCKDISLPLVRLHIQQAKRHFEADQVFVVIDHLQIFEPDKPGLDDLKSRIDYLISEFKAISEQYNATILLISEKNRESYDKKSIGSFMGSAGIEYGVDLAMLLHEEDEEMRSRDGDRDIELKIVKYRFGPQPSIKMRFYPDISTFIED